MYELTNDVIEELIYNAERSYFMRYLIDIYLGKLASDTRTFQDATFKAMCENYSNKEGINQVFEPHIREKTNDYWQKEHLYKACDVIPKSEYPQVGNAFLYVCTWKGFVWLPVDGDRSKHISKSNRIDFSGWDYNEIIAYLLFHKKDIETFIDNIIYLGINTSEATNKNKETITRSFPRRYRYKILERQEWVCNMCGCKLQYSKRHSFGYPVAHIDHVHPFSRKETYVNGEENINEIENLQALCPECNLTKKNKQIH